MTAMVTKELFETARDDDDVGRDWNPTLDNDQLTLGEVYESLPGFPPEAIHPLVCLFENPDSPLAFPGASSLRRPDCLHILLGRGLLGRTKPSSLDLRWERVKSRRLRCGRSKR